jgi:hypothetical protein
VILEVGPAIFTQASLEHDPSPTLSFLPSLGWQACATTPAFILLR